MFSIHKLHKDINHLNYTEYICDLVSDIAELPTNESKGTQNDVSIVNSECAVGSTAFVIEDSSVYMLGNDSKWHKL